MGCITGVTSVEIRLLYLAAQEYSPDAHFGVNLTHSLEREGSAVRAKNECVCRTLTRSPRAVFVLKKDIEEDKSYMIAYVSGCSRR